jgi:hypothetical protein
MFLSLRFGIIPRIFLINKGDLNGFVGHCLNLLGKRSYV